jgi:hypothetical protein
MSDIALVASTLSSLKTAMDIAAIIKQSGTTLEKAEFKLKTADLISVLADVKIQLADVQQSILDRDQTIRELNTKFELKGKVAFKPPFCWLEGDTHPHCAQCYENDEKLIHLQGDGAGYWECKTCKSNFTDESYGRPTLGVVRNHRSEYDPFEGF